MIERRATKGRAKDSLQAKRPEVERKIKESHEVDYVTYFAHVSLYFYCSLLSLFSAYARPMLGLRYAYATEAIRAWY